MKIIYLTKGYNTYVSDEDYNYLIQWLWCVNINENGTVYAIRGIRINGKMKIIYMHHVILKRMGLIIPKKCVGDHKDIDSLNNQRENLRVITKGLDKYNQNLRKDNTSGVKGIIYDKKYNKWDARITVNKNRIHLGRFDQFEDAVKARLKAEQQYY